MEYLKVRCNNCESIFYEDKLIIENDTEHCPICNRSDCLMDNPNTSIKIGLTYEDLEDLMADKSFDWTLENVDVHLYNEDENPN